MKGLPKIIGGVAGAALLSVATLTGLTWASGGTGQIEQGDIYRAMDVTTNSAFADNITVACGDTAAFRVRIHNGGPDTLTNVKVAATLDQSTPSTSHGSQVSLSADNNLDNMVVTANAGVQTSQASTISYISGSTELLNYSATPGGESVIRDLPDGILSGGINIGSIGPLTTDTEEVQFEAKLACQSTPPPTPVYTCDLLKVTPGDNRTVKVTTFNTTAQNGATFTNADINWGDGNTDSGLNPVVGKTHQYSADGTYTIQATAHFSVNGQDQTATSQGCTQQVTFAPGKGGGSSNSSSSTIVTQTTVTGSPTVATVSSTPASAAAAPPTSLVNTGPGQIVGLFAGTSALGALLYQYSVRRRVSRQA